MAKYNGGTDYDRYCALEMAIKELEEPKADGDCISRQAVLKLFATHDGKYLYEAIRDMPHLEPDNCGNYVVMQEPKQGHWYRQTNDYVDYYECSECGMAMGLYDVKNYCPNCGSRNEVEE